MRLRLACLWNKDRKKTRIAHHPVYPHPDKWLRYHKNGLIESHTTCDLARSVPRLASLKLLSIKGELWEFILTNLFLPTPFSL